MYSELQFFIVLKSTHLAEEMSGYLYVTGQHQEVILDVKER